ncbi:hypothetical protein GCM10009840_02220 [Pseudolysinimonas kribbensis]|uniref:Uncharacterized protein n=1 Tax=Pseudolysinimonas kribbensis TaxID=433641 RepID=A0ABQ6K237_9MICO|nr:hypothetical protein [Pseudolysinimonas kribbensis]GMA94508.1 hypothetical protein GCM10025881_13320 [Pseudolysinimonas kribbensis]
MSDPRDDDTGDEPDDMQEREAVEETEQTGEVNPSGLWPEGDEETRSPL